MNNVAEYDLSSELSILEDEMPKITEVNSIDEAFKDINILTKKHDNFLSKYLDDNSLESNLDGVNSDYTNFISNIRTYQSNWQKADSDGGVDTTRASSGSGGSGGAGGTSLPIGSATGGKGGNGGTPKPGLKGKTSKIKDSIITSILPDTVIGTAISKDLPETTETDDGSTSTTKTDPTPNPNKTTPDTSNNLFDNDATTPDTTDNHGNTTSTPSTPNNTTGSTNPKIDLRPVNPTKVSGSTSTTSKSTPSFLSKAIESVEHLATDPVDSVLDAASNITDFGKDLATSAKESLLSSNLLDFGKIKNAVEKSGKKSGINWWLLALIAGSTATGGYIVKKKLSEEEDDDGQEEIHFN